MRTCDGYALYDMLGNESEYASHAEDTWHAPHPTVYIYIVVITAKRLMGTEL